MCIHTCEKCQAGADAWEWATDVTRRLYASYPSLRGSRMIAATVLASPPSSDRDAIEREVFAAAERMSHGAQS